MDSTDVQMVRRGGDKKKNAYSPEQASSPITTNLDRLHLLFCYNLHL